VLLGSDPKNCGTCGHVCASTEVCKTGTCTADCGAGATDCAGACVNLTADPANCGACGHACSGGEKCVSSKCSCPVGFDSCNGVCTNTQSDRNNCGTCGHACAGNETCNGGNCITGGADGGAVDAGKPDGVGGGPPDAASNG
jgi:hypothetical protein